MEKQCSASLSLRNNHQCLGQKRPPGRFAPFAQATEGLERIVKYVFFSTAERGLEKVVKYMSFRHQNAIIRGPDTAKKIEGAKPARSVILAKTFNRNRDSKSGNIDFG